MEKQKIHKRVVPISRRRVNLVPIGKEFSNWTVLGMGTKPDYLKCLCSCGIEREVHVYSLITGKSSSCGCLYKRKTNGSS